MTKKINLVIATCAVVAAASGLHSTLRAQASRSVGEGVYTEPQAKRGQTLFAEKCALCHGPELKGSDLFPPLTGTDFIETWQGRTLGDLFGTISTNMPALEPGSLKPDEAADLVSYILSVSKYPAGTTDLESKVEPLKQIRIDAPKP